MSTEEQIINHLFPPKQEYVSIKLACNAKDIYSWEITVGGVETQERALELADRIDEELRKRYRHGNT